jgi:hypothetical protein
MTSVSRRVGAGETQDTDDRIEELHMKLVKSMVFMMVATTALGVWITAIALGA